jgi:hypothetical protein
MEPLRELLAVDERRTLEFFVTGLQDVSDAGVDRQELLYNASVLAHYALVSTHSTTEVPAPVSLLTVFEQFVLDDTCNGDPQLLETAAAQCLLLAGFFEDQARRRHSIRWYASLGASFFSRAAAQQRSSRKASLLDTLSRHFEPWRRRHARLGRELRVQPFLLDLS